MKKFLCAAAVAVILSSAADACDRAGFREVRRSKTVTQTTVQQKVEMVPQTKTVMVPKVTQSAPVTTSKTVETGRFRAVVGVPLTAAARLRAAVPCPGCR